MSKSLQEVLDEYFSKEELGQRDISRTEKFGIAYTDFEDDEVPEEFQDGSNFHPVQVSIDLTRKEPRLEKTIDDKLTFTQSFRTEEDLAVFLDGVSFTDLIYLEAV